ncbi:MAG: putative transcriptional acitvator, Baf family [Frankiales bacterium]|nr:putative transcriptional acitvator, Baf family [Frankiales bacterium]
MLLTVDVGNTNTVLGLFDGDELFESYRIKTDARVTADELALMFRGLLADHPAPDGVAVCSRSTPCAAAAGSTTGWRCPTRRW